MAPRVVRAPKPAAAAAATTRGKSRCSIRKTRAARVETSSPRKTGTGHCAKMRPRSYSSLTRWTVTPVTVAPESRTAWWTRCPYIPGPPKAGSRAGCTLRIRSVNCCTTCTGTSRRYPASTMRSTRCAFKRALNSSPPGAPDCRNTSAGIPRATARASAPDPTRSLATHTTSAGRASPSWSKWSRMAWRFVPPPEARTAMRERNRGWL